MNDKITYSIMGFLIGIIFAGIVGYAIVNKDDSRTMSMHNQMGGASMMDKDDRNNNNDMMGMHDSMTGMMQGLENKTGDEFDKAFIAGMILHHQGAIDMAEAALKNAKHQEIKDLANAIISAQTKEINQMKDWQQDWYK